VLKFALMATLALAPSAFAISAAAQSSLERGDYLVNAVMACDGCHTPRGPTGFVMEKRFSGGSQTWEDPAYTVKGTSHLIPTPVLEGGVKATSRYRLQKDCDLTVCRSRHRCRFLFTRS
jgi:mono/diheme cytochrome c family protein